MSTLRPRSGLRATALAVALAASLGARDARANGRFPAAGFVIAQGTGSTTRVLLRATFGPLLSDDNGGSFRWWCEQALMYAGEWDPPVVFDAAGTLHFGLEAGITRLAPGCALEQPPSAGNRRVVDLATSGDRREVYALENVALVRNRVLVSTDGGHVYEPRASFDEGFEPTTLDVAPSLASRVYVTARAPATVERDAHAVLLRSDDGARTFLPAPTDLGNVNAAYIAAVDPRDANTLWIRHGDGTGAGLVRRSRDGGQHFTTVLRTVGPPEGFAIAADGRVWIGGPDAGLLRLREDDTAERVGSMHVRCLRHHDGALYICGDSVLDRVALFRWRDGAAEPEPLLRFEQIAGAAMCPQDPSPAAVCAQNWPTLRDMLARPDAGARVDAAGPPDARGTDASTPRDEGRDAPTETDASAPRDEGAPPAVRCSCRAAGAYEPARAQLIALGAAALGLSLRRRHARRRRPRSHAAAGRR